MYCKSYNFSTKRRSFLMIAIAALMLTVCGPSVFAEENSVENSGWKLRVAPYLWPVTPAGVSSVVHGHPHSKLDAAFDEIH